MKESFLHFLWRTRRFNAQNLLTTEFQRIEIQVPGEHNSHAGPDFFNARLRIGDTHWAGNVEMHLQSSEWIAHGHSKDPAYDNVVLHVVLEEDQPIFLPNGMRIPCLELKDRIPYRLLENYEYLEQEEAWIPCEHFFITVPEIIRLNWLDRLLVERLELKTTGIEAVLAATENHWEETFYQILARNFGLKVNMEPFAALARTLPLQILAKHRSNLLQIEALVLGQAGFLENDFQDEWPRTLAREYRHLSHKYGLEPIPVSQWKFLRLRPANFPTIRLAQFAKLIHQSSNLFSQILEVQNLREIENLFQVKPSVYWSDHFLLDKASIKQEKTIGKEFFHLLIINTVVPFLFYYGKIRDLEAPKKRALALLEELPPESNALLTAWAALGMNPRNAFQTQALIHLKTRYCDQKRCLDCAIGTAILK
jgi:hypothetical protein